MRILEAFDLTRSYRTAARIRGCSHLTVARFDVRREAGILDSARQRRRPCKIDSCRTKIEEWVTRSRGNVRADVCHRKL